MKIRAPSILVAATLALAVGQLGARTANAQPVEPRFQTALLNLYYARWMLTHTAAVRANEYSYHVALNETYTAIRDLNGIINVPNYRYAVPAYVPPGGPRLHATLSFLQDARNMIGAPSAVPRWEVFRQGSLTHVNAAIANVGSIIAACRC